MSVGSDKTRSAVTARAEQRCEYCHLPSRGQVATFPIDHVTPETSGGPTILDNLALACPCCNGHKWKHTDGIDATTGTVARLFHPRLDLWIDHFAWSEQETGVLVGKTAIGRATISRLQINDSALILTRQLLGQLGLFPDILAASSHPTL
jgi:hypothetical protein